LTVERLLSGVGRHDIYPKLLELTKELVPDLKRVCVLFDDSRDRNLVSYLDTEFRALSRGVGVSVCVIPARTLR
jgi:hypothetical protein